MFAAQVLRIRGPLTWRQTGLIRMSTKASSLLLLATLAVNLLPREVNLDGKLTCRTDQLKDIIQDLYELMVQTTSYGNVGQGVSSKDVLQNTVFVTNPPRPTSPPRNTAPS